MAKTITKITDLIPDPSKQTFIYVLRCPETNRVRYVGKSNNPKQRYNAHLKASKEGRKYRVCRWIFKLLNDNTKPILEIIESCNNNIWKERESYWINHYRVLTKDLTNNRGGGDGADFISEETREKMSNAKIGKSYRIGFKNSELSKQKMSDAAKRRFLLMTAEEKKEYASRAFKFRGIITEDTKQKLSVLAKERMQIPKYKEQQINAQIAATKAATNRVVTEEERNKRSKMMKERYKSMTEEQRTILNLKISNGRKNIKNNAT